MEKVTVTTIVNSDMATVWKTWTTPKHIQEWNHASPDWHTPSAANDLRIGGKFSSRMEAKDGSMGFDFEGVYHEVVSHQKIAYTLDDGRKVDIVFENTGQGVQITESFEPESQNPKAMQQQGWQAILDNFKKYVESL